METILHFIGLCPDSMTHQNLINFVAQQWPSVYLAWLEVKFTIQRFML